MPAPRLKQSHVRMLQAYDWPGNVRELQNIVERAVITLRSGKLKFDLPTVRLHRSEGSSSPTSRSRKSGTSLLNYEELRRIERENLVAALAQTNWRIAGRGGTAELLGINASTLRSRIKAMGIKAVRAD